MIRISRRQFLIGLGTFGGVGLGIAARVLDRRWWERVPLVPGEERTIEPPTPWSTEARYYASFTKQGSQTCGDCHSAAEETLPVSYCHIPHTGSYVQCTLCPHRCVIAEGERGTCRVRENRDGVLYSVVYGNPCAYNVDPIEKKPFYHFLPTAPAFSIATAGCNLRCLYCQNWDISQQSPEETFNIDLPPAEVVKFAAENQIPVIAYTYSEPTIFYEYMLDTAMQGQKVGLRNVVISAGYFEQDPLRELCSTTDAIKIDLKGYDEDFYREVCGAELKPVLRSIQTIFEESVHLEIVNLVVPTLNDDLDQLRALSHWIAKDLSVDVPLHFSRFHPQYKLVNLPSTPVETLEKAREIALEEGMRFVYIGNVAGHPGNNTYCPECGEPLIIRQGFAVLTYHIKDGACEFCNEPIPGVWWSAEPAGGPVQVLPGPPDS